MRARITGLGAWYPEQVRTNADWPQEFAERGRSSNRRELVDVRVEDDPREALGKRYLAAEADDPFLGARKRRVAPADVNSCLAESKAGAAALLDAGVSPDEVDVVMSWAAVPDRVVPPSAPRVADLLGIRRAMALGLEASCATSVAQLGLAAALIESGRARCVLLTQSHMMTRAFPLMHPASPNVGDAATAMVVCAAERRGIGTLHAVTHGEYYPAVTWCRGKEEDPPWWKAGPDYYPGSLAPELARSLIAQTVHIGMSTVSELLVRAHVRGNEINVFASVQPRRWVPGAIAEAAGLAAAHVPVTFDEYAHLGACGVVSNLLDARANGHLAEGSKSVLFAQGAGLTRAAILVDW
ncbi:MAG: hypothetical protein H6718_23910 [Polyangiaceae bacterium]|nr:hypothetical protein [Myxococcales bacterium]MCB9588475.1 hypothetical protein [Polyangiaceae bacterium]